MIFILSALSAMADPGISVIIDESETEVSTKINQLGEKFYSLQTPAPSVVEHRDAIGYMLFHGSAHVDLDFAQNPEIVRDIVEINGQEVFCGCTGFMGNGIGCSFKFSHNADGETVLECTGMCDNDFPGSCPYPCEMVDENNDPVIPDQEFAGQTQSE